MSPCSGSSLRARRAYWEEKIHNIHQTKNRDAHFRLMIAVTCEHETASNDVMDEHLPIIFSSLFNVDHNNLLNVEGELYEVVPLVQTSHLSVGPAGPQFTGVKPVIRVIHEELLTISSGLR